MRAVFKELPSFERAREAHLDDAEYSQLQDTLMDNPDAGELIKGTGGLRKLRFRDKRRQKGTRGGLRIIYYWWRSGLQFWLFAAYDKAELIDLSPAQKKRFRSALQAELHERIVR